MKFPLLSNRQNQSATNPKIRAKIKNREHSMYLCQIKTTSLDLTLSKSDTLNFMFIKHSLSIKSCLVCTGATHKFVVKTWKKCQ